MIGRVVFAQFHFFVVAKAVNAFSNPPPKKDFDLVSTLLARRQISFLEILLWIRDEVRFGKVE